MLFYAHVVLGSGGFYLQQLFDDVILKGLLLGKSS